jgi:hypothetical protein
MQKVALPPEEPPRDTVSPERDNGDTDTVSVSNIG